MKHYNISFALLLTTLCMLLLLPFIGITDFNTKGEPREALVVMSMIDSGNWIFPFSDGGDMAYKPPFFHWCILILSKIWGGQNEFTSRLPSTLAFLVMLFTTIIQIKDRKVGILTGLILMSMFEVHRSAMSCRVDMMLAACVNMALFSIYQWTERNLKGVPIVAALAMSLAVLTKGPVGIVLPCLVGFVFAIVRIRKNVSNVMYRYMMVIILSLIIPAVWYWKAYTIAGETFLNLVVEENLGRFLGRMSYESHTNPFFMPFVFLMAGTLPYSLFFFLRIPRIGRGCCEWRKFRVESVKRKIAEVISSLYPFTQFCILTLVFITLFYCIPSSKRSVYLLPVYPSIAYLLALAIQSFPLHTLRVYVKIISSLCCIVSLIMLFVMWGPYVGEVFRHNGDGVATSYYQIIRNAPIGVKEHIILLLPIALLLLCSFFKRIKSAMQGYLCHMTAVWSIILFFICDATVLPVILGAKSDRGEAQAIEQIVPKPNVIYSYCSAPMMRFFALNYYMGNRIHPFALCPREQEIKTQVCRIATPPCEGYILITDKDCEEFLKLYGNNYSITEVYRSKKPGCDVKNYFRLFLYKEK